MRIAMEREDFFVTPSNAEAVALIDLWPDWPVHAAVISGASGSGKTHLANVFAAKSGAVIISASSVSPEAVPTLLKDSSLVVEDLLPERFSEAGLFHLINLAKEMSRSLLFTSEFGVEQLGVTLPDLQSRMRSLPSVRIHEPDDALLRAVILKQFSDRQLRINEDIISFLISRIPRSLADARAVAAQIDRHALKEKSEITRVFVSRVLKELDTHTLTDPAKASSNLHRKDTSFRFRTD
jgi:chromosomal replication initiation ATPase DnaA